ncbi:hypothetical protein BDZ94DRAFT_1270404 [Collybia nuda]|uniref:Uncharacterized protein n=1 Tax=Collybia nuda TaxID=64659 RepID=A0A9P5XZE3_9AGAR|nr:hypothetical protein BDZ94DRAFT_1270404 [Collybia nuda]
MTTCSSIGRSEYQTCWVDRNGHTPKSKFQFSPLFSTRRHHEHGHRPTNHRHALRCFPAHPDRYRPRRDASPTITVLHTTRSGRGRRDDLP